MPAWPGNPLHVHPVPLPDGPEAGPNLIRELLGLCLLGWPLRQTPPRGLGDREDSDGNRLEATVETAVPRL